MNRTISGFGVIGSELMKSEIKFLVEGAYFKYSSERKELYNLYRLFRLRGDEQMANELWINLIKNNFVVKPV